MKLTRASSYAIHAIVHIAAQNSNKTLASHDIAKARKIPERFLLKVLKPLVSAGLLYSVKGPNGGYRLARQPNQITMLDVVEAVDGPIRGMTAFTESNSQPLGKKLETICSQAAQQTRKAFQGVRLSQLAGM
jgi:Rrf2 family protein